MKVRTKIEISQTAFIRKLNRLIDTEQTFSSHPHTIKKPYFGEITDQYFKIKNTPTLFYRDASIVILGKFQKEKLEVSIKPNNLIFSIILIVLLLGLVVIFLAIGKEKLAIIGLITIPFSIIYIMLPYVINKNKFMRFLTEIASNK